MEINKVQWRMIAKGAKLPCDSFLMKKDGTMTSMVTGAGVTVGQDAYYLPVEELRSFPKEESEDERIRKGLIDTFSIYYKDEPDAEWDGKPVKDILAWLEKQGEQKSDADFSDLRTWKYIVDAVWTEKEGIGQYLDSPFTEEVAKKLQKRFGNIKQKPVDKAEPKFKVKYAGSEYNVLKVKDIAGVTYYGIEDEPNHIDYIKADNCEIISGYGIKENGSPYPTKPAVFSGQKPADKVRPKFKVGDVVKHKDNPHLTYILKRFTDDGDYEFHAIGKDGNEGCTCFAVVKYQDEWELVEQNTTWNEEDEIRLKHILRLLDVKDDKKYLLMFGINSLQDLEKDIDWLKSLKDRVQPQSQWKPSDEQLKALNTMNVTGCITEVGQGKSLVELYNDLKKLREK